MQQLDYAELDEDGRLVVVGEDGTRYAVPVDDRLRAALRSRPAAPGTGGGDGPAASPREVQAMIRAGQTADEVAEATGWDPDRVRRFEGPVLAEREHVVGLAKAAPVRAQGRTDGSHTLDRRVRERLEDRGVPVGEIGWDAARSESHGPWTVLVAFTAGGRERRAAWHYDVHDRSIEALDDEARWLSEDEQALPGGLAGHPLLGSSHSEDETADLMATMRERRQARGRRGRRGEGAGDGSTGPAAAGKAHEDEVLPLENLPEPAAHTGADEELPPAAHPRGSAAESPAPVHPADEEEVDPPAPARRQGGQRPPRTPRERRRLRMPKLPPAVGEPPAPGDEDDPDAEGSFARTVDPQEVSFDEFFGPDDDPLAVDEGDAPDGPAPETGDLDLDPDVDPDPGQDEPVDPAEQLEQEVPDDDAGTTPHAAAEGAKDQEVAAAPEPAPRRKGRTSVPSWDDIMFGGDRRRR